MRNSRIRAFCPNCKLDQEFVQYRPHHAWHFIVTVLTLGLWAVSWCSVCVGAWFRPWRCKVCGWHQPQLGTHQTPLLAHGPAREDAKSPRPIN